MTLEEEIACLPPLASPLVWGKVGKNWYAFKTFEDAMQSFAHGVCQAVVDRNQPANQYVRVMSGDDVKADQPIIKLSGD